MPLTAVTLEFSEDDLSDTTPTWTNVTTDCMGIEWWSGIDREGNDPQPGGATIQMRSDRTNGRRWEPDYVAGAFYPNVVYGRRFRLTLDDAVGSPVQEGLWYITDIAIDYPMGTNYSVVTLTCADGFEVLALDDLPTLDPPDAQSYPDVVTFDDPFGYWRLDDPAGTRAQSRVLIRRRGTKKKGDDKPRRKLRIRRGTRYSTASEAGATSGPTGTYKARPFLGQTGLVLGDSATSTLFDFAMGHWVRIPLEDGDLEDSEITLEAVVKIRTTAGADRYIIAGPATGGGGTPPAFFLRHDSSEAFGFGITDALGNNYIATGGVNSASTATTYHVCGTFDGQTVSLYQDGVLVTTTSTQGRHTGSWSSDVMAIGSLAAGTSNFDGNIQEAAVYEYALSATRVAAHATAALSRGYAQEDAAGRVDALVAHALWNESGIPIGSGRDLQPVMQHGQPRLDELSEAAHAEGVRAMFFFNGSGDPIYLGHEWPTYSSSYNTVQATLGDTPGESRYSGLDLRYDNETFNEVTASRDGGEEYTAGTGTPPPRRSHTEFTDVLLVNQNELESLAEATLDFYEEPTLRPVSVTLNGNDSTRLNHILRRDIGHLVRVKKSGDGGTQRIDRVANIIGKRKALGPDFNLVCTWTLGRGFNAVANGGTTGYWQAGVVGFSEAGQTTVVP